MVTSVVSIELYVYIYRVIPPSLHCEESTLLNFNNTPLACIENIPRVLSSLLFCLQNIGRIDTEVLK